MCDEQNSDLEAIYHEAASKPPNEREVYIQNACGGDLAGLARIKALLRAREVEDSFLEEPALDLGVVLDGVSISESPGTVIDRYTLQEKIGEGGMAVVYMAEQEQPIRRKVALKIIKLGMDTRQVIARFEAERQALALMDHANIAKVLDAGATETGRPYFVMELVTGISIIEYCDQNALSTKDRLALFIQVCNAIQHAHQKGIIHRDIKPSNVMVAQHEGTPVPKVIDFGIAKATNQRLTEKTLFTRYAHIIGTPAYMSPEQAELSDMGIDTRSDIYSLGVLLYELLTGITPFSEEELRQAGYVEMTRIIREQEPPRPSTRLTQMQSPISHQIKNQKLTIENDLDWIVMKCLEKDRIRRYGSTGELTNDIQRHLADDIVLARPPSVVYQFKKFLRRHQALATSVVLVLTVVVTAIIAVAVFAFRANRARNESMALVNFFEQDIFGALDPWRDAGRQVSVDELLDIVSQRIEDNFRDQRTVEASIRKTLGLTYYRLGKLKEAEHHLQRSLDICRDELGEDDPSTLEVMRELGYLYYFQRESGKAADILRRALTISRRVLGNRHPDTLRNMHMLGAALKNSQEAELLLQEALESCEQVLGPNHEDTMICLGCLGMFYMDKGQPDVAEQFITDMLHKRQPGPRHLFVEGSAHRFHFMTYLASVYNDQARYTEARELAKAIVDDAGTLLGRAHCETLFAMVILSMIYESEGRHDDAESLLLKAVEIRNQEPATQPDWIWPEYQLGRFYLNRKRYQEAHDTFMMGIEKYSRFQGESNGQVRWTIRHCANLWEEQGKPEWAEQYRVLLPEKGGQD